MYGFTDSTSNFDNSAKFNFKPKKALTPTKLNAKPSSDSLLFYKDGVNCVDVQGNNAAELFKYGSNMFRLILHLMSIRFLIFKLYKASTHKIECKPSLDMVL